jgi:glycosyltransferase involved in cell wall biosynthesis
MTERTSDEVTRVAVAAPARERCGVADYARRLAEALPERFEVTTIDFPQSSSRSAWREAAAEADTADVVHVHYETGLFGTVKPYRNRFGSFVRRQRPPVVVSLHDLLPRLTPRWLARPPYGPRDALRDIAYLPFFRHWERAQYGRGSHWLVHTREHQRAVAAATGETRVSRWIHPIPSTDVLWRSDNPTGELGHLVSPGFIKAHKGYSGFVRTVARLSEVTWTLAGGAQDERDRHYAEGLCEEIKSSDLTARIRTTGYLQHDELEALTARATLAVFPFDRVTGSGSVALAIALGMPVVATDLPGLRELVDEGAGVELLPRAEPDCWADRIARLLASPDQLRALAAMNREHARHHSYARAGERLGALFDEVLCRA